MKIKFVFKDFVCSGGVERVQHNLAKQFLEDGHEVVFYILNQDQPFEGLDSRIKVIHGSKTGVFSLFSETIKLKNSVIREKVDFVISAKEQANLVVFGALLFTKVIPIYTRHSALDVSEQKIGKRIVSALYSLYSLGKGRIVAVSDQLKIDLSREMLWRGEKVTSCPNPVISQEIFDKADESLACVFEHTPYICSVGRLTHTKGYDTLIKAYAKYLQENTEATHKLVIAGDGEDREVLQSLAKELKIQEKVVFLGHIENPYAVMKNSSGFILSSRNEGLPTVLIEAMALGVSVVSTDCPTGPKEILGGFLEDRLVPVGCIQKMAESIETVISNELLDADVKRMDRYTFKSAAAGYYKTYMEAK